MLVSGRPWLYRQMEFKSGHNSTSACGRRDVSERCDARMIRPRRRAVRGSYAADNRKDKGKNLTGFYNIPKNLLLVLIGTDKNVEMDNNCISVFLLNLY